MNHQVHRTLLREKKVMVDGRNFQKRYVLGSKFRCCFGCSRMTRRGLAPFLPSFEEAPFDRAAIFLIFSIRYSRDQPIWYLQGAVLSFKLVATVENQTGSEVI